MRASRSAPYLVIAAGMLGCGGDEGESGSGAPDEPKQPATVLRLTVETKPGKILFDKKRLAAPAGPIRIELTNPTQLGHNVRIQTGEKCCFAPGHKDLGGTRVEVGNVAATVTLKPGRYFFLCSVAGHWQRGQRGTLVVQ